MSVSDIQDEYVNVGIPFNKEVLDNHGVMSGAINGTLNGTLNGTMNAKGPRGASELMPVRNAKKS